MKKRKNSARYTQRRVIRFTEEQHQHLISHANPSDYIRDLIMSDLKNQVRANEKA
jgi:hypothetical protein